MPLSPSSAHGCGDVTADSLCVDGADGIINDMDATIRAIIQASVLPLSIIIIGVGMEDFAAMRVLDADATRLESGGMRQERDNVQFVPFREFQGKPLAALSAAVLEEIPGQILSYMQARGIVPSVGPAMAPR